MNKHWEIKKRYVHLYPAPKEEGRLTIVFKPTKYWLRKNKHLLPEIYTTTVKGQTDYPLPKGFRSIKNILSVNF